MIYLFTQMRSAWCRPPTFIIDQGWDSCQIIPLMLLSYRHAALIWMKDGWRLDYHARKVEIILPNSCFQFSAQASMFETLQLHREGARNHHEELVSVWLCLQAVAAAAAGWAGERWKWRWSVRGRPDHTLTGQSQLNVECYPGNFPNGIELNVFAATVQLNSYCSRTTRASEVLVFSDSHL